MNRAVIPATTTDGRVALEILSSDAQLGKHAAHVILDAHRKASLTGRGLVLGCPAGRSPRSTYAALGDLVAQHRVDLSDAHVVLMDEFVERRDDTWCWCAPNAHYSCRAYAATEIVDTLNRGLPAPLRIPTASLHVPDPTSPAAYEALLERLGGIDVFLLASGCTDGHVAFNPPGTALDSPTRVVELADTTRRDNLGTFPEFRDLAEVPRWGVTVGLGTIRRHSRAVLLLLAGASKGESLRRISAADGFEPSWPATFVHACRNAIILVDEAAASAAGIVQCAN